MFKLLVLIFLAMIVYRLFNQEPPAPKGKHQTPWDNDQQQR